MAYTAAGANLLGDVLDDLDRYTTLAVPQGNFICYLFMWRERGVQDDPDCNNIRSVSVPSGVK